MELLGLLFAQNVACVPMKCLCSKL